MPMTMTIPEVLESIKSKSKNRDDIVRHLRENSSLALKQILNYAFFDNAKWYRSDLPAYTPDPSPEGLSMTNLFIECKRLYIFKESYNLPRERKDILLIQVLEGVHPSEATLLRNLLDGSFGYAYGLDKKIVKEAFPDLDQMKISA